MSWNELLAAALTLVVGFLLQLAFKALKVEIDPALFNTIVAAIVAYFLALFGVEAARAAGVKGLK